MHLWDKKCIYGLRKNKYNITHIGERMIPLENFIKIKDKYDNKCIDCINKIKLATNNKINEINKINY